MEFLLTGQQHFLSFQGAVAVTPLALYLLLDFMPPFLEASLRICLQLPKETFLLSRILNGSLTQNLFYARSAREWAAKQVRHFGRVGCCMRSESGGNTARTLT